MAETDIKSGSPIKPAFIVGTGRCGSTMLSEMLSTHPDILSISEFFPSLGTHIFRPGKVDGTWFWKLLSQQSAPVRAQHQRGIITKEVLYPYANPTSRYRIDQIPPILLTTLPHITADYESLYDELAKIVPSQGTKPIGEHYRWLFDHLTAKFQRQLWIERSGLSLAYIAKLKHHFPDARFIHIYRDGRDVAISMSRHPYFQIMVNGALRSKQLGIDPFQHFTYTTIPKLLGSLLERLAPLAMYPPLMDQLKLKDFAWFWSELVCFGKEQLREMDEHHCFSMKFEEILSNPTDQLEQMIQFINPALPHKKWIDQVESIPKPVRSRFSDLSRQDQRDLTRACEPGLQLLGYLN